MHPVGEGVLARRASVPPLCAMGCQAGGSDMYAAVVSHMKCQRKERASMLGGSTLCSASLQRSSLVSEGMAVVVPPVLSWQMSAKTIL